MSTQNITNDKTKKKPCRYMHIVLLFALFFCLPLTACSKKETSDSKTTSKTVSSSEPSSSEDETVQSSDSAKESSDEYNLPDEEILIQNYTDELLKLTDSSILSVGYQNFSQDDSDINLDIFVDMSDGKLLKIHTLYLDLTKSWVIVSIENAENSHTYYLPSDLEFTYDIYDYSTDTLIPKENFQTKTKLKKVTFVVPSDWEKETTSNGYSFSNSLKIKTYINIFTSDAYSYSLDTIWNALKTNYDNYSLVKEKNIKIGGKKGKRWHFTYNMNGSTYDAVFCMVKYKKQTYCFYALTSFVLDDTVFNSILDSVKWKK